MVLNNMHILQASSSQQKQSASFAKLHWRAATYEWFWHVQAGEMRTGRWEACSA